VDNRHANGVVVLNNCDYDASKVVSTGTVTDVRNDIVVDTNELQTNQGNWATATSVGLTAAAQQDIAQIVNRATGNVYYLDANGGDGDGLTPDTSRNGLKARIEAGVSGDIFIIAPGTHALGNAVINIPDGVSVYGAGMDATRITSTASLISGLYSVIVKPGGNAELADLTVEGTLTNGTIQACVGTKNDAGDSSQAAFTNAVIRRVRMSADADGAYLWHDSACTMTLIDCIVETKFDSVLVWKAADVITAINCIIKSTGPSTVAGSNDTHAIRAEYGTIYAHNCQVHATAAEDDNYGVTVRNSGTVEMYGGAIYTAQTDSNEEYAANNDGGTLLMLAGVDYDRTKTNGTITEVSGAGGIFMHDMDQVEASAPEHSLCTVVLAALESSISGTTWTIKRTDGSTTHATKTITADSNADPVTGVS
jgi:hypothetical protein